MIARYVRLAAAVLPVAVLASCSAGPTEATPREDPGARVLGRVISACDEFGNRVYVRQDTEKALAVVGQDPTCPAVSSGKSGLDGTGSET
jgi:hypothetical protein